MYVILTFVGIDSSIGYVVGDKTIVVTVQAGSETDTPDVYDALDVILFGDKYALGYGPLTVCHTS